MDAQITMLISIHPPLAGRDSCWCSARTRRWHFNPPAPCGAGRAQILRWQIKYNFNPPAPCGAGPVRAAMSEGGVPISIHPPLAGRDQISAQQIATTKISIHPPLAGRDLTDTVISFSSMYFNPPAPCGAGPPLIIKVVIQWLFQSTRPLRGGTHKISACEPAERFQSTRPLRGGTSPSRSSIRFAAAFQSTRPLRGGTGTLAVVQTLP